MKVTTYLNCIGGKPKLKWLNFGAPAFLALTDLDCDNRVLFDSETFHRWVPKQKTGIVYHHAFAQTDQVKKDHKLKFHRDVLPILFRRKRTTNRRSQLNWNESSALRWNGRDCSSTLVPTNPWLRICTSTRNCGTSGETKPLFSSRGLSEACWPGWEPKTYSLSRNKINRWN